MKIRIKKLVDYPTVLEYSYATATGEVMAVNSEMKSITYSKMKDGSEIPKKLKFDKNTFFIDADLSEFELNFLKAHSQVKHKGSNPNLTNPLFELVNVGEEQNQKVLEIKKIKRVMNIVDSLSVKGIYELCNYLLMDVRGKDISDIYVLLLDPQKGIAYKNYDKVVNLENDEDAELVIIVNKALTMGILTQEGSNYLYNHKPVASSLNELHFYFKNLPDLYEKGLKSAVAEAEVTLPINIQYASTFEQGRDLFLTKEKASKEIEEITDEMYEWAKIKADEMDIKGRKVMKRETLVAAVMKRESNLLEWQEKKEERKRQLAETK